MRDLKDPRYKKWRDKVYKKDKYTCIKCFAKKDLEAHHSYSWDVNEKYRYDIRFGFTFCLLCHSLFHDKYGYGKNTILQLELFLGRKLARINIDKFFKKKRVIDTTLDW